jgi:hypothetical protein
MTIYTHTQAVGYPNLVPLNFVIKPKIPTTKSSSFFPHPYDNSNKQLTLWAKPHSKIVTNIFYK